MAALWAPRRRRRTSRRDWSFIEFVAILFVLGLVLELLYVTLPRPDSVAWLWILPGIAALVGIMWLVSREPANL